MRRSLLATVAARLSLAIVATACQDSGTDAPPELAAGAAAATGGVQQVMLSADAPTGGLSARPVTETFADAVAWLYETGRLTARAAGRRACPLRTAKG